jgi:predicted dinucleotide-binding enzyme
MQLAILGTGNIGGNLGQVLAAKGHQIYYGARNPASPKTRAALATSGAEAKAVSIAEAVAACPVVFVAVQWEAVPEVLAQAGDLNGKIVVDCTNNVRRQGGESIASVERFKVMASTARIVKAFNAIAAETILKPHFGKLAASLFFCGADEAARTTVKRLGEEIGFQMVDLGGLENIGLLEQLMAVWSTLAYGQQMGRRLAWHILTQNED